MKSMVVSQLWTYAPSYGDLRVSWITFDSRFRFESHLREVVLKAGRRLAVVQRTGKLPDCSRVLKNCFNVYVLFSL